MALNTVDYGSQTITYDFQQPAETRDINKQLYKIIRPGVYEGFQLSVEQQDPPEMRVGNGICYIHANNEDLAVRIETADDVIVDSISSSYPYIVIHYEWYDDPDSFAQILALDDASITEDDIVLGKGVFTGSDLTGVENDDSTHPREYVSNYADTLPLGESATVESTPTGGTITNLNGETTDVVEALQEAFDRLIDLSGVNNDGVKNRHVDFGESDTQVNGGDFPLASTIDTGGTASDISSSTSITSALQDLADLLANLSGADTDSVKERHIDFGTGSNEIDADLLPLGTSISKTLSEATNIDFPSSEKVRNAIQDVIDRLSQVSNQVTTNKNNINSNDGDIADLQNQIDKTSNIPVGTIWMYDGSNWVDDSTLPGWYACISSNSDKGAPDLVDHFIKGSDSSGYQQFGGQSTYKLKENDLPPHSHSINHGHTVGNESGSTQSAGGSHSHSMSHTHEYTKSTGSRKVDIGSKDFTVYATGNLDTNTTGPSVSNTGSSTIDHAHDISVDNHNGSSGDGGFSNNNIDINPQHYKVIYIRKCFQR